MDPRLSHALLAALYTAVLAAATLWLGLPSGPAWSAAVVAWGFWNREAGQRNHDLTNAKWDDTAAYFASQFGVGWTWDNWQQALAPAASSALVAAAFTYGAKVLG